MVIWSGPKSESNTMCSRHDDTQCRGQRRSIITVAINVISSKVRSEGSSRNLANKLALCKLGEARQGWPARAASDLHHRQGRHDIFHQTHQVNQHSTPLPSVNILSSFISDFDISPWTISVHPRQCSPRSRQLRATANTLPPAIQYISSGSSLSRWECVPSPSPSLWELSHSVF